MKDVRIQFGSPGNVKIIKIGNEDNIENMLIGACQKFEVNEFDRYCLRDHNTLENMEKISQDTILLLDYCDTVLAAKSVKDLREHLNDALQTKKIIFQLQKYLKSKNFSIEFLKMNGLQILKKIALNNGGNILAYTLCCFSNCLKYYNGEMFEEIFDVDFINFLLNCVFTPTLTISRWATATLICIVQQDVFNLEVILTTGERFSDLIDKLNSSDLQTQLFTLQLLNSVYKRILKDERVINGELEIFYGSKIRDTLIKFSFIDEISDEIVKFQSLFVQNCYFKRNSLVQDYRRYLERFSLQDDLTEMVISAIQGQTCNVLNLSNLAHFVKNNSDRFLKMADLNFSFCYCSFEITEFLSYIWHFDSKVISNNRIDPPLLCLERVHDTLLTTVFRIWREERANVKIEFLIDCHKVYFKNLLEKEEFTLIDQFETFANSLTFNEAKEFYELHKLDGLMNSSNIKQRIQCLTKGEFFLISSKELKLQKAKMFIRLSSSQKYLAFSIEETSESVSNKLDLNSISNIKWKKENSFFHIFLHSQENVVADLAIESETTFNEWLDGLSFLILDKCQTEETLALINNLSNLELEARVFNIDENESLERNRFNYSDISLPSDCEFKLSDNQIKDIFYA
ncbi:hypothetical protein ROZALSC1DRAFT_29801 [Rozella allomycis CSF55]|uniref:Uncharacterized protein n=1 Tax=Rozella allomycis (strain CSF55) TaxID=988480 RepID=A0A4V1IZM0_ROZAC|nr:hypothetical protein ROZALSC1DRAFT_29801 [Rozella allomycis CSF55]